MKKEIVLRKNIYSGKEHKLIQTEVENEYKFKAAESWMPVYLTYENNGTKIVAFDSDGFGSPAYIGDKVDNYIIEDIFEKPGIGFIFKLKEK